MPNKEKRDEALFIAVMGTLVFMLAVVVGFAVFEAFRAEPLVTSIIFGTLISVFLSIYFVVSRHQKNG